MGVKCECGGLCARQGSGPTGRRKQWMIRVDQCQKCGRLIPAQPKLTYEQQDWVFRFNRHIAMIKPSTPAASNYPI